MPGSYDAPKRAQNGESGITVLVWVLQLPSDNVALKPPFIFCEHQCPPSSSEWG